MGLETFWSAFAVCVYTPKRVYACRFLCVYHFATSTGLNHFTDRRQIIGRCKLIIHHCRLQSIAGRVKHEAIKAKTKFAKFCSSILLVETVRKTIELLVFLSKTIFKTRWICDFYWIILHKCEILRASNLAVIKEISSETRIWLRTPICTKNTSFLFYGRCHQKFQIRHCNRIRISQPMPTTIRIKSLVWHINTTQSFHLPAIIVDCN